MKRKQRFLKSSALVGCILLGVGIVMGSAGFVAMGCDLDAFTYPRVEANPQSGESASSESGDAVPINGQEISHVPADTVDSLEIHASMGNVTVERTAGSQEVEIILTENVYQATVEEGLLVVRPLKSAGGQNGWNWYQLLNLHSNRDWDVTIRVPEKLLDSVFVETSMGIVDLSDLQAGSVTVQGDMGDVALDNVSASESMTVTQSMGRVTMENCQGGTLLLENDMGTRTSPAAASPRGRSPPAPAAWAWRARFHRPDRGQRHGQRELDLHPGFRGGLLLGEYGQHRLGRLRQPGHHAER